MTDTFPEVITPEIDFEPFEIEDQFGEIRRCGSIPSFPPEGSGLKTFASSFKIWTLAECRKAIVAKTWLAADFFPGEGEENQGSFSSCNGYALANASWRAAYAGGLTNLTKRSGDYPYSLMNGGRDQGSQLFDGFKVGQQYGLPSQASCKRGMIYRSQTQKFDAEAATFKVNAPLLVNSWDEYLTATAGPFMLVVAVQVGANFERIQGDKIGLDHGSGNHAVCQDDARVTDSGDIEAKIILDWGRQHGINGCGWVDKRHLADKMQYHQFYAIPIGQFGSGTFK